MVFGMKKVPLEIQEERKTVKRLLDVKPARRLRRHSGQLREAAAGMVTHRISRPREQASETPISNAARKIATFAVTEER